MTPDRQRRGALALAACLVTACAAHHVTPEDPAALVPDRTSTLTVGQSTRAEVRDTLGAPVLSSAYWKFDLFRAATEQAEVAFALTPWPVPFARIADQVQRYTLVAYDARDRVDALATGLFRRPAAWRNVSPIADDFPSLHLRAGDLMFFVDPEGARAENLLVSPRGRDAFLRRTRPVDDRCTMVLGCGDGGCGDLLSVDGGAARRVPLRTAHAYWFRAGEREPWVQGVDPGAGDPETPWMEVLVAVRLAPGEHTLEFSAKYLDGSAALNAACRAGEVSYVVVQASTRKDFWRQALVDWRFGRSDTMPERYTRRALVLVDDGRWTVDAEPE